MKFYKSSVGKYFMIFAVVPVLIIGFILTVISTRTVYRVKVDDTKTLLKGLVQELAYTYELLSEEQSGFHLSQDTLYAGEYRVSGNFDHVDKMKAFTGVEYSVFFMDTRIVTTLEDETGQRLVNQTATEIWDNYVSKGNDFFGERIEIAGRQYFGYYMPIYSWENKVIGMYFAGIPSEDINDTIHHLNMVAVIVCILLCVVALVLCSVVTGRLLKIQNSIMEYLKEIDNGNFNHKMAEWIARRKDEYGVMSRYFTEMNNSLRDLILMDGLTGLLNRRAAMKYLEEYIACANNVDGETFTLAIGDIDFFKMVNDTYGHNCGDEVLRKISAVIGSIPDEEGFSARWGGEEFIIVFRGRLEPALRKLEAIAEQIRNMTIEYENKTIRVTMTFGVAEYVPPKNQDWIISSADSLLYKGKENGRNTIVS